MVKEFNVIIENNGKFEPYNIMKYLKFKWKEFVKTYNKMVKDPDFDQIDDYWKYPKTYKEIWSWVNIQLKYQYWSRCEYEMVLSQWPYYELDEDTEKYKKGTAVIPENKGKKIDVYWQCSMNMDTIVRIFIEDIYLPSQNERC